MSTETGIATIALVDDSLALRRLLGIYLSAQGFHVLCEADNGQQLLTALAEAPLLPDLCLLDTNMSVMDGYETARRLKADYPSVQILAYSFFDTPNSVSQMLSCGAHDIISKDASAEEVRDALKSLLADSRMHREFCVDDMFPAQSRLKIPSGTTI